MDSRLVQNQAHENDEHIPHIVASEPVTHGAEEQYSDHDKKSVLNKVKAKARKIKDTIKKHGHQVLDRSHEDQHTLDDPDLDEDEEMTNDPQVHETSIHESEDVKTVTPTSEKVENLGKSENDFGVKGEAPGHDALLGDVSSTTEIDQNTNTESAETFSLEEKPVPNDNLERSTGLEEESRAPESTPEMHKPPNYHSKVPDPSGVDKDEIEITPVEESFGRMNVQDEPKPTPEPNVQPSVVVDPEYPPAGSHDQFVPHLSAATQTQNPSSEHHDHFTQDIISSTNITTNPAETGQTINAITTPVEDQPLNEASTVEVVSPKDVIASEVCSGEKDNIKEKVVTNEEQQKSGDAYPNMSDSTAQSGKNVTQSLTQKLAPVYEKVAGVASTDEVVSPKDVIASEVGSGEKDNIKEKVVTNEEQQKSVDASPNMSDSTAQSGKNVTQSLTQKLAPVYEKVAGVGSAVKSKVTGGVGSETKDGVSVKDYLAEKLRPGEEDKALSEVISEALHKRKEEAVTKENGKMCDEKDYCVNMNSQGKGVVDKLKGVVGSWFGKSEEKGGGDLSKNTNSGAEVEQVNQVVGEIKSSQIEEQGTL